MWYLSVPHVIFQTPECILFYWFSLLLTWIRVTWAFRHSSFSSLFLNVGQMTTVYFSVILVITMTDLDPLLWYSTPPDLEPLYDLATMPESQPYTTLQFLPTFLVTGKWASILTASRSFLIVRIWWWVQVPAFSCSQSLMSCTVINLACTWLIFTVYLACFTLPSPSFDIRLIAVFSVKWPYYLDRRFDFEP